MNDQNIIWNICRHRRNHDTNELRPAGITKESFRWAPGPGFMQQRRWAVELGQFLLMLLLRRGSMGLFDVETQPQSSFRSFMLLLKTLFSSYYSSPPVPHGISSTPHPLSRSRRSSPDLLPATIERAAQPHPWPVPRWALRRGRASDRGMPTISFPFCCVKSNTHSNICYLHSNLTV